MNFAESYKLEMQKCLGKRYVRWTQPEEVSRSTLTTWCLPHIDVAILHKPAKLRIV